MKKLILFVLIAPSFAFGASVAKKKRAQSNRLHNSPVGPLPLSPTTLAAIAPRGPVAFTLNPDFADAFGLALPPVAIHRPAKNPPANFVDSEEEQAMAAAKKNKIIVAAAEKKQLEDAIAVQESMRRMLEMRGMTEEQLHEDYARDLDAPRESGFVWPLIRFAWPIN